MARKLNKWARRCKSFELREVGRCAMPGLPILARLDGRAFHTFTRGMDRPYDAGFITWMQGTMSALVEEFHASIGYTQSDEITLLFPERDDVGDMPFGGRFQKLTSVLAGFCSAAFMRMVGKRAHKLPHFDCRVWQVPTRQEAASVFIWREDDAAKNSLQMAAQGYYSHRQLHGKHSGDLHEMLHDKGVNWNNYPACFKRGTYGRRIVEERELTDAERAAIPEKHRPTEGQLVTRSRVALLDVPPIRRMANRVEFLFDGADPILRAEVDDG